MATIDVGEIKRMLNKCLEDIESSHGNNVTIKADYYWHVSPEQWSNVYESPKELTVGQLSDDLDNLRKSLDDPITIPYCLVWLSSILRAMGQELV